MAETVYQNLIKNSPFLSDSARANENKQPERALLRIMRPDSGEYYWIRKGKPGSLQTAFYMARLVREDTIRDAGLQKFAANIIIKAGLDSHSPKRDVAKALFEFVQTIKYIHDPAGSFEAVGSARQTIANGFGDCDDLSVLLATLLAQAGFEPRFVLARYNPRTPGYDHIYVDLDLPGGRMVLDPSSRRHMAGWESSKAIERLTYPIFAFPMGRLGDAAQMLPLIQTGVSAIPVVGPILAQFVGPIANLFNRQQQRSEEAARDTFRDQVYNAMGQIQDAVKTCQITPAQGTAAARELITQFYGACDKFTKVSVAASCRNYGSQADAFPLRLTNIAAAGGNCGGVTSAPITTVDPVTGAVITTPGVANSGAINIGGTSISTTTLLMLGVGGFIAWKMFSK